MGKHYFAPSIAEDYGLNAAILFADIEFWCKRNAEKGTNIIDGRAWTYTTLKELHTRHPYLSVKQIRAAIDKLKESGLILVGRYNKSNIDRTHWYAIGDAAERYSPESDKRAFTEVPESDKRAFTENPSKTPESDKRELSENSFDTNENPESDKRAFTGVPTKPPKVTKGNHQYLLENKIREHSREDAFSDFWGAYPKKVAKQKARASFDKLSPEVWPLLAPAIERQKETDQWKRDGGRYIPNPSKWLDDHRWEDETEQEEEYKMDIPAGMERVTLPDGTTEWRLKDNGT